MQNKCERDGAPAKKGLKEGKGLPALNEEQRQSSFLEICHTDFNVTQGGKNNKSTKTNAHKRHRNMVCQ